jgi:hypothetical protein
MGLGGIAAFDEVFDHKPFWIMREREREKERARVAPPASLSRAYILDPCLPISRLDPGLVLPWRRRDGGGVWTCAGVAVIGGVGP